MVKGIVDEAGSLLGPTTPRSHQPTPLIPTLRSNPVDSSTLVCVDAHCLAVFGVICLRASQSIQILHVIVTSPDVTVCSANYT